MLKKPKFAMFLPCLGLVLSFAIAGQTDTATPPAEGIKLQFRPLVGQERVIRLQAVQNMTQVRPQGKSTMRQTIALDTRYQVLSVDENGLVRLRATPVAVRFDRAIDGKEVERYDSANPPKQLSDMAETLALMNGFEIVLQMNSDGTVKEVEDREALAENMMDRLKVSAENREMLRPMMIASLSDNAFKNIGNTFASFPAQALNVGDSWPKRDVVSGDWNLIYDGQLQLAKNDEQRSTLHLKSVIKPDPARKEGAYVFPVQGSQKGYFFVETDTGWTQRGRLEQRWTGRLNEDGQFVTQDEKSSYALYMKMTFDVGTLSEK